jgi:hypothetical protein
MQRVATPEHIRKLDRERLYPYELYDAWIEAGKAAGYFEIADNSAGHFVVPPEVLTLLPASTTTSGVSNGNLVVSHGVEAKFDAPGVGQSLFTFVSGATRNAEFK